jgi:hypothetical protein
MLLVSFHWCVRGLLPCHNPRKLAVLAGALLFAAGCGGGGGTQPREQIVRGDGYTFTAPAGWSVSRHGREQRVAQGTRLVSVTLYPLERRFRPALWQRVVPELDRAAEGVARQQHGSVAESRTLTISGLQARRYDIEYELDGKPLVERIAFVLRGKSEYLLLCRYERGGDTGVCDRLLTSFKLAAA